MEIDVPELAIVAIIGDVQKDRIKFAQKHFKKEEIFNSTQEDRIEQRLKAGELVAIHFDFADKEAYKMVMKLGKKQHAQPIAILIYKQREEDEESLVERLEENTKKKGFKQVEVLTLKQLLSRIEIKRTKLSNNKREIKGPFDIIGDVHGCYDELCELLEKLGYEVDKMQHKVYPSQGRKVVFCGDLVDRGPKIVDVLKLVMGMVESEVAYAVIGNHDGKLQRKLNGANVQVIHGLEVTLEQLGKESEAFREKVRNFLGGLVSHYVFDEGKLVVAHAGLKERLQGRESKRIRDLAMFGETTGKVDEFGLPIRLDWSAQYKGRALVVYGHTPKAEATMNNYTINIDTGCVYGGKLTAFRYPEQELVQVNAKATYYESIRPI